MPSGREIPLGDVGNTRRTASFTQSSGGVGSIVNIVLKLTSPCLALSPASPAAPAASAAPMSGRCLSRHAWTQTSNKARESRNPKAHYIFVIIFGTPDGATISSNGGLLNEVLRCQTGSFWNAREFSRNAPSEPPIQSHGSITARWRRTTGRYQSSRRPCGSPRRRTERFLGQVRRARQGLHRAHSAPP
jgi:hypothetical protein